MATPNLQGLRDLLSHPRIRVEATHPDFEVLSVLAQTGRELPPALQLVFDAEERQARLCATEARLNHSRLSLRRLRDGAS